MEAWGARGERAAGVAARCGAVRCAAPSPRVSHAVAGSARAAQLAAAALPAVPALSARWLADCVRARRLLPTHQYLLAGGEKRTADTPVKARVERERERERERGRGGGDGSPMARRNLALLRSPPPAPGAAPASPEHLLDHYLSQDTAAAASPARRASPALPVPAPAPAPPSPRAASPAADDSSDCIEQIFKGVRLEAQALAGAALEELRAEVEAAGGALPPAPHPHPAPGAHYALVPLCFDTRELLSPAATPVTALWIKDCLAQRALLPPQYYHAPVSVAADARPLAGVVASLSTYSGVERAFLDELARLLGATTQLRFCRRDTASARASTHLVCPAPSGDKYCGALKWGLPAVRAAWLRDCAAAGRRLPERAYLVGEARGPEAENVDPERAPPPAEDALSPASRYIAMARQGLLGGDSQEEAPRPAAQDAGSVAHTPPPLDALSTPNLAALSPTTRRRLRAVRQGEMPSDPVRTPRDPFSADVATPDSAFGCALRPGAARLSPDARKRLWALVHQLPAPGDPPRASPAPTPLSEIRNRFLSQFHAGEATPPAPAPAAAPAPRKLRLPEDQEETPPAKIAKALENQSACSGAAAQCAAARASLARLDAALAARARRPPTPHSPAPAPAPAPPPVVDSEPAGDSQPNTVGWDDTRPAHPAAQGDATPPPPPPPPTTPPPPHHVKRFMLSSNVDNREELAAWVAELGGGVCEGADAEEYATHLLCAAPSRSERVLGSVAAGRWLLHPRYVRASRDHGAFLPEERFEWGNPAAADLPALSALSGGEAALARAAHRWRVAREAGRPPPFAGLVALLHVREPRRRLLARLVRAGGGDAPDAQPPYAACAAAAAATLCLAEARLPLAPADAAWLAARGVPVCAAVLLSALLTDEPPPDPRLHTLPPHT